jgi:hypothetical protein
MSSTAGFAIYSDPDDGSAGGEESQKVCIRCLHAKGAHEFFVVSLPLSNVENGVEDDQQRQITRKYCISCSNKRKVHNSRAQLSKRRKSDEVRLQSMQRYTWEQIVAMIDEGFVLYILRLMCRTIESGDRLLISELYSLLPTEISREDQKSVAQYIADQFGEAEGFQYCVEKTRTISERASRFPSEFANATDHKFTCSQRRGASNKPSNLPYSRTRNRRSRKVMHNCHGGISVIFPSSPTIYDVAVQFVHSPHPGYEHYGVPHLHR